MKWLFSLALCCSFLAGNAFGQTFKFSPPSAHDDATLTKVMPALAGNVLAGYQESDRATYLNNVFRLHVIAGDDKSALAAIDELRILNRNALLYTQYELFARARDRQQQNGGSFEAAFAQVFREHYRQLDAKAAINIAGSFVFDLPRAQAELAQSLTAQQGRTTIEQDAALKLLRQYQVYSVYRALLPLVAELQHEDDGLRYLVQDDVLIKTRDGATLSAIVVRPRAISKPVPAILQYTIYTDDYRLATAKTAAANGYVGVVADVRGKRLSPQNVMPYEFDGKDAHQVIDWISKQPWSDGQVGMMGGSYAGFTQWAAAKYRHPALKTIVPSAAVVPGIDMPMENGVVHTFQYPWPLYVSTNKLLDTASYGDQQRWDALQQKWYESGAAYQALPTIDGTPNPIFQRWLQHPAYDNYWQKMGPYRHDFARIDIPVLTTTGYFDGAQAGALHYFHEHQKYNKNAEHYLLIGPYDHFGAQARPAPVVAGYAIDPVARINIMEVIYQWFDHVLKGAAKPALLQDKINFAVMGANTWKHAGSLAQMRNASLRLRLSNIPAEPVVKSEPAWQLCTDTVLRNAALSQSIDFTKRSRSTDNSIHSPLQTDTLDSTNGLVFVSEAFSDAFEINGAFTGALTAVINKKDMDVGVQLYELSPAGEYFQLSYFLGRASYAKNKSRRQLLKPGRKEIIPISNTRMISRQISKGSRLVVVLNINQSAYQQINYGTGQDVSVETIADAKEPLQIEWYDESYIELPVWSAAPVTAALTSSSD